MKILSIILISLVSITSYSQKKPIKYYDEKGSEITLESFIKKNDYIKNLAIYFENDSIQYGHLFKRMNFGKLKNKELNYLKDYLNELSKSKIDSTESIVINYITSIPKRAKDNPRLRSTWNLLDRDYLKNLHKISNIKHFWVHSPNVLNLKYFHSNKLNWLNDKEQILKKRFFPNEVYGHTLIIKPNGLYVSYIGEHGKTKIWKLAKEYLK